MTSTTSATFTFDLLNIVLKHKLVSIPRIIDKLKPTDKPNNACIGTIGHRNAMQFRYRHTIAIYHRHVASIQVARYIFSVLNGAKCHPLFKYDCLANLGESHYSVQNLSTLRGVNTPGRLIYQKIRSFNKDIYAAIGYGFNQDTKGNCFSFFYLTRGSNKYSFYDLFLFFSYLNDIKMKVHSVYIKVLCHS